jgi:DNA helicase HerA-like ATPase
MTKIQLAALKRARVEEKKRKDFYLYVDEFQNFATPSFAQILSEARKYKLNAILAHQTTSQIEDKSLIDITLANTGTVICFRTANPEDEKLLLPQFYPYVDKGEIASLPSFHFYIKINALSSEEPFSGETVPFSFSIDKDKVKKVIEASRKNYTVAYKKPIQKIVPKFDKKIIKKKIETKRFVPDEAED